MIPRLRFFYGGSLHEWLHEVPAAWFWAHLRALPRLLSEQSLTRISDSLASNGATLKPNERTAYIGSLERDIPAPPKRRTAPPIAALRRMGVNVKGPEEVKQDDGRRRASRKRSTRAAD